MTRVLVVGEALVDVVDTGQGSVLERPGGSPANVAVGLARLGHDVTLLTALGPDAHARLITDHLIAAGVAVIAAALPRTSSAAARLDASGSASYAFDIAWDIGDLGQALRADWLHVGSLGTALRPGADQVLALAQRFAGAATPISFDPNCRPGLTDRDLVRVEQLVSLSRVTKLSNEDLAWLCPAESTERVAARWLASGPELVALTRGASGATGFTATTHVDVPPAEGAPIVDTVGAGDGFMAGLLDGLLRGRSVPAALERACLVARRTCERVGADPPTTAELLSQ